VPRWSPLTDITHIAYTALHEKPDLVAGWSSKDQIETNNTMLRNVVEPILGSASDFQHISILQGTKVYGVHLHSIPIPARESDPRDPHDNFFLDQEDYVTAMGAKHGFTYTALRPQLVTGPTPGTLNVLPAIGVYAAIQREKGEPFGFTGGPSFVWEAADADLVADVMVWAAGSSQAANQAFNITNGDVFEWRNVWPALAETLGVETGPDIPMSLAAYLADHSDLWDRIVAKYGLRPLGLRELVGHGDQHADFAFAYDAPDGPRAFVSTIKLGSPKPSTPGTHSATDCSHSSTTNSCQQPRVDGSRGMLTSLPGAGRPGLRGLLYRPPTCLSRCPQRAKKHPAPET
jgi:nucleoside-diphosphate-sugar epimerase